MAQERLAREVLLVHLREFDPEPGGRPRTSWNNYISDLAWSRLAGCEVRSVTSLGHHGRRRVFWEWPKFVKLCPIPSNYVQHISPGGTKKFLGGDSPPYDSPPHSVSDRRGERTWVRGNVDTLLCALRLQRFTHSMLFGMKYTFCFFYFALFSFVPL